MKEHPLKNYSCWGLPLFSFASIESALETGFSVDGLYQITVASNVVLDVLIRNTALLDSTNHVLVAFNGAVTHRESKKGPFFSGTGITKSVAVPSISFADPSLDLDAQLGLAWYAGNEKITDLPEKLASIVNSIAKKYSLTPVFFGGSGAGFAILNLLPFLTVRHFALVWNPQTRIVKYFPRFVEKYAKSAFPGLWAKVYKRRPPRRHNLEKYLDNFFDRTGISHRLEKDTIGTLGFVLYMQNRNDWHVQEHADPFLRLFDDWTKVGPAAFLSSDGNLGVVFGDWGVGHVAPPRATIVDLLTQCIHTEDVTSSSDRGIFSLFNQETEYEWRPRRATDQEGMHLNISWSDRDRVVSAAITVSGDAKEAEVYLYAFYLKIDDVKQQARLYKKIPYVQFQLSDKIEVTQKIEVVGYLKNSNGEIRRRTKKLFY